MNGGAMQDTPERFDLWALIPLLAGLLWIQAASGLALLIVALPGALLVGAGVSQLLWPGDAGIPRFMALGGFLGTVLGLFFWAFGGGALLAALLSAASFLVAGRLGLRAQPRAEDIPQPPADVMSCARTAMDEAVVAYLTGTARVPSGEQLDDVIHGLRAQRDALRDGGFDGDTDALLGRPSAPEELIWQERRLFGTSFRSLHFESEFQAADAIPGAAQYMRFSRNHQTAAWVFEHEGEARPWLVCIHGYRMGVPWMDLALFPPALLHKRYGLNLLMPVLPLHGPRRAGLRSGDHFLDGDFRNLLHAECQALWDLRRHLAWLRAHGAQQIGVIGFSLGAYNAALLAQHDNALDFVIAGIPVADLSSALWPSLPANHRAHLAERGDDAQLLRDVLAPVSPLTRPPLAPRDRRYVFGGLADRLVPPQEVAQLARHWGVDPAWYPGGHLSFRGSGIVTRELRAAMQNAGWSSGS